MQEFPKSALQNNAHSIINEAGNSNRRRKGSYRGRLRAIVDSLQDELMVIDRKYRVLDVNNAVLSRHGKSWDKVIGRYCYEISHGASEPCRPPQHECPIALVFETESPVRVNHVHVYYTNGEKQERYVDIIATPIRDGKHQVIAIIELMRDVTQAKELELKIANLHEELQHRDTLRGELLREILSIQEEERGRIARELHDETGQILASLNACLEAAAGMLPDNTEQSKAMLKKAQALSVRLLDDIHRLVYELRPALLDDLGLVVALRWLVDNSLSTAGVSVDFRTTGKKRKLPSQLETTLFRVIQEATTNIVRHAHAKTAKITLIFKKGSIAVSIRDNGKGFDVEEAISSRERPRGLGLLGMKERIELMHGTLDIRSQSGCGTEIDIVVPVNNE